MKLISQIRVPQVLHMRLWKFAVPALCVLCIFVVWIHQSGFIVKHVLEKAFVDQHTFNNERKQLFTPGSLVVQDVCQSRGHILNITQKRAIYSVPGNRIIHNVYINRRHKLMYCAIPKIGSSFWKRIMKVIDESNSKQLHLFDMSSMSAHIGIPESMKLNIITSNEIETVMATYMKFLFVRDPFSRLFSAYVDKILVPSYIGLWTVNMFMHLNHTHAKKIPCNRHISFGDFCDMAADAIRMGNLADPHFTTMSSQCDPCLFNFTFIGKLETFMSDTSGILRMANINFTEVTGDVEDLATTIELSDMKDIITRVLTYTVFRNMTCITYEDIAERLWRHLQIRGFVSKRIPLPMIVKQNKENQNSPQEYITAALQAQKNSEPRKVRLLQRQEAMLEAYANVPRDTLHKLSLLFAKDCSLFDYSCDTDKFENSNMSQFYFRNT